MMSDVSYPSPVWIADHSKAVGSFFIILGFVVIVAGYLLDALIVGAFIGGVEIVLGIWIIGVKNLKKFLH
jgi:hypothetical protein